MSTVAAGPRSIQLAFTLLDLLNKAISVAEELEETAYQEVELGLMYAAKNVREDLEKHREAFEKLLKSKGYYT